MDRHTDPARPGDTILVISGSQDDDDLKVQDRQGDYLRIKLKDRDEKFKHRGLTTGDADRIIVFGHAGDDELRIYDDIDLHVEMWGIGTGPRDNGSRYLRVTAALPTDITVFTDAAVDELYGNAGSDWFLSNSEGLSSLRDEVEDKTSREYQDDIDDWPAP